MTLRGPAAARAAAAYLTIHAHDNIKCIIYEMTRAGKTFYAMAHPSHQAVESLKLDSMLTARFAASGLPGPGKPAT